VPLLFESFDLVLRQRSYFQPPMQALMGFIGGPRLRQRAADLTGYDVTPAGKIRYAR
jgi:putative molybdopterin biosynthesis protein